jgi:hypothetical protein
MILPNSKFAHAVSIRKIDSPVVQHGATENYRFSLQNAYDGYARQSIDGAAMVRDKFMALGNLFPIAG